MSSATILRAFITRKVLVFTTIPSVQPSSAGGSEILSAYHFDYADATRSGIVFNTSTLQVDMAESGDVDTDFASSFEDGTSFGHA